MSEPVVGSGISKIVRAVKPVVVLSIRPMSAVVEVLMKREFTRASGLSMSYTLGTTHALLEKIPTPADSEGDVVFQVPPQMINFTDCPSRN
jgi:hypothetical protein